MLEYPSDTVSITKQFENNFKELFLKTEIKKYDRLKEQADSEYKKVRKYINKSA